MTTEEKREHEKRTVNLMIQIYCRGKHRTGKNGLCGECRELTEYCDMRTDKCPFMETKTFCSACKAHCYSRDKREKIREVMRYSGPRMLLCHPALAVKHAAVTLKNRRQKEKGEKGNVS